jgi:hypothetical protein
MCFIIDDLAVVAGIIAGTTVASSGLQGAALIAECMGDPDLANIFGVMSSIFGVAGSVVGGASTLELATAELGGLAASVSIADTVATEPADLQSVLGTYHLVSSLGGLGLTMSGQEQAAGLFGLGASLGNTELGAFASGGASLLDPVTDFRAATTAAQLGIDVGGDAETRKWADFAFGVGGAADATSDFADRLASESPEYAPAPAQGGSLGGGSSGGGGSDLSAWAADPFKSSGNSGFLADPTVQAAEVAGPGAGEYSSTHIYGPTAPPSITWVFQSNGTYTGYVSDGPTLLNLPAGAQPMLQADGSYIVTRPDGSGYLLQYAIPSDTTATDGGWRATPLGGAVGFGSSEVYPDELKGTAAPPPDVDEEAWKWGPSLPEDEPRRDGLGAGGARPDSNVGVDPSTGEIAHYEDHSGDSGFTPSPNAQRLLTPAEQEAQAQGLLFLSAAGIGAFGGAIGGAAVKVGSAAIATLQMTQVASHNDPKFGPALAGMLMAVAPAVPDVETLGRAAAQGVSTGVQGFNQFGTGFIDRAGAAASAAADEAAGAIFRGVGPHLAYDVAGAEGVTSANMTPLEVGDKSLAVSSESLAAAEDGLPRSWQEAHGLGESHYAPEVGLSDRFHGCAAWRGRRRMPVQQRNRSEMSDEEL